NEGAYNITVWVQEVSMFPGHPEHAAGKATALFTVVDTVNSTATSLSASPNPSLYGQNVTLTATVMAPTAAAGSPALTGFVQFRDNNVVIGSAPLNVTGTTGTATFST